MNQNKNSVYVSRERVKIVLTDYLKREPRPNELNEVMRFIRDDLLHNLKERVSDAVAWTGVDRERD